MADIAAVSYYNRHAQWKHFWKIIPWMAVGVLLGVFLGKDMNEMIFRKVMVGIILFTIAKNNAFYYFYEEYPEFNNRYVNSLPEPYKTLGNDIDAKYYDSRIQLASQNNQSIY